MPTAPNRRVRLLAPALAAASVTVLAGCATSSETADGGAPSVVATTTQVADFTREVGGEAVEVTALLEPGQSAHSFDPSAAQLLALGEADALVVNGGGLESWLDDAIAASGFEGELIDASTGIELSATEDTHAEDEHADEEEHSDDEHAEEELADEEHAEEGEEHAEEGDEHSEDEHSEDEHGEGNPHIWTDPHLAGEMVENIADGLAELDGVDAESIRAAQADYQAQLEGLDEWIHENVEQVPTEQRLLVTNHDAFTYFLDAYDVIDALVERIRETGVQAVFSEASISPKAAETIASEAGVTVYSGDDALYGDSLGQAGSEGETYLGSQVHNARLILESWGVEPSALPDLLEG
jgi:ABC-type Zn uptake system ZnuABC Zn-binding protein ZnuA